MAYSDVIIRQCGPRDADSDNDSRILWRMLKMMIYQISFGYYIHECSFVCF